MSNTPNFYNVRVVSSPENGKATMIADWPFGAHRDLGICPTTFDVKVDEGGHRGLDGKWVTTWHVSSIHPGARHLFPDSIFREINEALNASD